MKEADVRRLIQKMMRDVHWCPIESRMTGRGIPDLNGCLHGIDAWIEIKRLYGVRKLRFRFPLKPSQALWLRARSEAGGRAFVLAREECGTRIGLWTGHQALDLSRQGPDAVEPAWWFFDDDPEMWPDIQKTIFTYRT